MTRGKNHKVIENLSRLLADSYVLTLKTQNYHWNVTGPHFAALHAMFEEQYNALAAANDEIAERIRALGEPAPGSFVAFAKLATITEETGAPDARAMVKNLAADHNTAADTASALLKAAQEVGDEASADIAIGRIQAHQKTAWMLNASV